MTNITMTRDGNTLTIVVDLSKRFGQSASGKSETIATTSGNKTIPGAEGAKLGLNVYVPVAR